MRISTFFYTIKQGLVNIWKNKMFSLASIATMTACIFLFGLFYSIVTMRNPVLQSQYFLMRASQNSALRKSVI